MTNHIASQEPTTKKNIQKKVWDSPTKMVIDSNNILAGHHPGGFEANYAPGHVDSSPAFYNFFS